MLVVGEEFCSPPITSISSGVVSSHQQPLIKIFCLKCNKYTQAKSVGKARYLCGVCGFVQVGGKRKG